MSRLYDTVEPSVIDEDMLQKSVEEQGPKEEAGKIAKREGIDFGDVLALRLEFKSKTGVNLSCIMRKPVFRGYFHPFWTNSNLYSHSRRL